MFISGQRVVLIHTKERGVISQLYGDGMVDVVLDDGDQIPVDSAFIIYEHLFDSQNIQGGKHDYQEENISIIAPQFGLDMGFFLGFDPQNIYDKHTDFDIYCINDSKKNFSLKAVLQIRGVPILEFQTEFSSYMAQKMGKLEYKDLSENPKFSLEFSWENDHVRNYESKLKPAKFYQSLDYTPIINKSIYRELIWQKLEIQKKLSPQELRNHSISLLKEDDFNRTQPIPVHEVFEYAKFNTEIDLHIEALRKDHKNLDAKKILEIQLKAMEDFINQALRHGVERVFIIHGLGKGKLKEAIHRTLQTQYPIKSFKNEYHPNYGFGATEVIFL